MNHHGNVSHSACVQTSFLLTLFICLSNFSAEAQSNSPVRGAIETYPAFTSIRQSNWNALTSREKSLHRKIENIYSDQYNASRQVVDLTESNFRIIMRRISARNSEGDFVWERMQMMFNYFSQLRKVDRFLGN